MPPKRDNKDSAGNDQLTRIAIVNSDRCKPKNCGQVCKKSCPVVRMGKQCIVVEPTSKVAELSETLCIGCGICVKKCPYDAIQIINLPSNLGKSTTHRYSANSFKLHRLPTPRSGEVLGLVGTNGIGKSTALKILAGKLKPNLGRFGDPPDWTEILAYFRGSELQNYFTKILEDNLKAVIKPQYVDQIPKAAKGTVIAMLDKKDDLKRQREICEKLDLLGVLDRNIDQLSGGELQRFAIAVVCVQKADIYMFDEPSSYLDVKQRLKAAATIRGLVRADNYVIVVEHDLAVLDYLSDFICCLYGVPGAYGVVTLPSGVREGINIFLDGFVPTENLRFRETALTFKVSDQVLEEEIKRHSRYNWPKMVKQMGNFKLTVEEGNFTDSEIIVMLGENGTGKTTMIKLLAGRLQPDNEESVPELAVSYKPQAISPKSVCSVRQLLHDRIRDMYIHPQFVTDVIKPLLIEAIMDQEVQNLSGGELQRVALTLCLGKPANVYLIDEPSAYLDSEQRLHAAKVIKRFILHAKKTAFVVEHDFIMATYLADRVIVFDGKPSVDATANTPQSLLQGMNRFLELLDITFRRDPNNYRPRINKAQSVKDKEDRAKRRFNHKMGMSDQEVQKQLLHMMAFIEQEATEKAEEIDAKAEEEFNIEKGRLVQQQRSKIMEYYEKKEKQVELQRKIQNSNMLNQARLKVLKAREDHIASVLDESRNRLTQLSLDPQRYPSLLRGLIMQALFQMLEGECALRCRQKDVQLLEQVLPKCLQELKQTWGKDCRVTLDRDNLLSNESAGGVELLAMVGKIRVSSTLEKRLELISQKMTPEIRVALFGRNPNRKFLD